MKYFTAPNGLFIISIPIEWQYQNVALGYEEKSPFSFQLYRRPVGAFQLSCYSADEKPLNSKVKIQSVDTSKLEFITARMDDSEFNIHLWYATVENYTFMAKYIYDANKVNDPRINKELAKAVGALTTLILISPAKRELAVELDRYEKFMASLAASFDLKTKAFKSESLIELLIIVANQIDAYLRMAIVMKKQLKEKTNRIDITILYQGENDPVITERRIYEQAKNWGIIDSPTFDRLETLYKERNKVVHRYIITEFRTRDLYQIAYDYEVVCEDVRLALSNVENQQFSERIGIHGGGNPKDKPKDEDIKMMLSKVNDKHLVKALYRKIK